MPFGINVKDITAQVNAKFEELMVEVRQMRQTLVQILAAVSREETSGQ